MPPKISEYSFSIKVKGLVDRLENFGNKVRRPKKLDKPNNKKDSSKRCEFHGDIGHTTDECITLKKEVAYLFRNEYLKDILTEKTKAMINAKHGMEGDSRSKSPVPIKVINFITGGSYVCGLTYSATKRLLEKQKENHSRANM